MSAFLDLQNEIKNSVRLSSEDKATMLCLLAKTSEENIKTTNELMAFVCQVGSEISSMAAKEEHVSMTLSKWLSSTKVLGGGESISVLQGGVIIPLSSMSEADRKDALGSDGWCQVSQIPPSPMTFTWVRKD